MSSTTSLFDPFGNRAQIQGANTIASGIQQGQQQALPYYQQGLQQIGNFGQQALDTLGTNWNNTLQPGVTQLRNVLGFGPGGMAGALKTLRGTPGYAFAQNAGQDAIAANAAKGGTLGSGSETTQLARFNQGLADTTYNNYVSQLQPFLTGAQNVGGQISGAAQNIGGQMAGGLNNIGNMFYGGATSAANALAGAQANTSGSANLLNLLLSGGSGLAGGLGSLGSGLGSLFGLSDAKLKEDIEPVGALASGETVYRYRFKGEPRTQIGLIAQEVEGVTPDAVIEFLPDLRAVDYHRATERAAKILELSRQRGEPTPTHRPFASELMELAA